MTHGAEPGCARQLLLVFRLRATHSAFLRSALETVLFAPVMMFNLILQIYQRILYRLNEIPTTGRQSAHIYHRFALGDVIRDRQDLAVCLKSVRRAFNHLVSGLARLGEKNFHLRRRTNFQRPAELWAGTVEKNRDGRSIHITVEREDVNQLVARGRRKPRLARRQFGPAMQQAVTIHKDPNEAHPNRKCRVKEGGCRVSKDEGPEHRMPSRFDGVKLASAAVLTAGTILSTNKLGK